ncbi:hypothetical protein [Spiribacter sp. SSL99]|uniref:hypothetical protein n=1 Tax=Spiribacter sp. SSL99 TaxID=1866884 RepID=UPI0013308476|nr:hypothetical protein [Spiribacter sp. SSL99]
MKRMLTLGFISIVLVGCASNPELSREEWLDIHNHTYPDASAEEVISAAEEVLRTADPNDVTFTHREDGFLATRQFLYYFVLAATSGQDFYDLTATEREDGGVDVSLYMSRSESSLVGQPTGGGGASVTTIPGNASPIQSPAAYFGFWRRIEYFLGQEDTWYTCDRIKAARESREDLWGHTDNICGIGFQDNLPTGSTE